MNFNLNLCTIVWFYRLQEIENRLSQHVTDLVGEQANNVITKVFEKLQAIGSDIDNTISLKLKQNRDTMLGDITDKYVNLKSVMLSESQKASEDQRVVNSLLSTVDSKLNSTHNDVEKLGISLGNAVTSSGHELTVSLNAVLHHVNGIEEAIKESRADLVQQTHTTHDFIQGFKSNTSNQLQNIAEMLNSVVDNFITSQTTMADGAEKLAAVAVGAVQKLYNSTRKNFDDVNDDIGNLFQITNDLLLETRNNSAQLGKVLTEAANSSTLTAVLALTNDIHRTKQSVFTLVDNNNQLAAACQSLKDGMRETNSLVSSVKNIVTNKSNLITSAVTDTVMENGRSLVSILNDTEAKRLQQMNRLMSHITSVSAKTLEASNLYLRNLEEAINTTSGYCSNSVSSTDLARAVGETNKAITAIGEKTDDVIEKLHVMSATSTDSEKEDRISSALSGVSEIFSQVQENIDRINIEQTAVILKLSENVSNSEQDITVGFGRLGDKIEEVRAVFGTRFDRLAAEMLNHSHAVMIDSRVSAPAGTCPGTRQAM